MSGAIGEGRDPALAVGGSTRQGPLVKLRIGLGSALELRVRHSDHPREYRSAAGPLRGLELTMAAGISEHREALGSAIESG